jgi:hypothetical protein
VEKNRRTRQLSKIKGYLEIEGIVLVAKEELVVKDVTYICSHFNAFLLP